MASPADALSLRLEHGWRTPIAPLADGELWCLFDQRGTWEVLVTPNDAALYLAQGIVVDGHRYRVKQVDEYPFLNGVLLSLYNLNRDVLTFVAAYAA